MQAEGKIKCVIWDLDQTLWDGILAEGDAVRLRTDAVDVIAELDARGILQSVASRNDHDQAWSKLESFGLSHYFLYPQIHWGSKSGSVDAIAKCLNIGLDTFAFVDDQPFERDEVQAVHPSVRVFDAVEVGALPALPAFMPRFITEDARRRREMYQADAQRNAAQEQFGGTEEAFLRSLQMHLRIRRATHSDLQRAEELTQRTNQLNTTGIPYSYDELAAILDDPGYLLLVADLTDRYGAYGTIGLILLQVTPEVWTIALFLMSCRVMSRGVGGVILSMLRHHCNRNGLQLDARFRQTDRNRMMYVTYRFAGFAECAEAGDEMQLLRNDLSRIPALPDYFRLDVPPEFQVYGC